MILNLSPIAPKTMGSTKYLVYTFQLFSILTLVISIWLDVYPDADKRFIAEYSTTIIGVIASLNLFAISIYLNFTEQRHEAFVNFTEQRHHSFEQYSNILINLIRNQERVEVIDEREFYVRLKDSMNKADNELLITYLSAHAPNHTSIAEKIQYLEQLQNIIEQRPDLKITRIVRATPATAKWIHDMVQEFHGRFQMSLAYIEYDDERFISPVSVQIIDRRTIFLLNLGEDHFNDHRIYMNSKAAADLFVSYYRSLWHYCRILINGGKLSEANWRQLMERYQLHDIVKKEPIIEIPLLPHESKTDTRIMPQA
ncbi:hypothetical protein L0337_11795 [candidate division KSB1 bacterium]|nr:hypothetical protein [candidate division KSB1 bacterium]